MVDSCTPDDVLASMSEQIEVDPYVEVSQLEVLDSAGTWKPGEVGAVGVEHLELH